MGLGNQMFLYASLYGLAKRNKKTPILDANNPMPLLKYFPISTSERPLTPLRWIEAREQSANAYSSELSRLTSNLNIQLNGYLQSWKYFEHEFDDLRNEEFAFVARSSRRCIRTVRKLRTSMNCTLVGVHVRRGDFALAHNTEFGHSPASATYVIDAYTHCHTLELQYCFAGEMRQFVFTLSVCTRYIKQSTIFIVIYSQNKMIV
jgi:galactoside 2-L-fucosyltransferase 1/2